MKKDLRGLFESNDLNRLLFFSKLLVNEREKMEELFMEKINATITIEDYPTYEINYKTDSGRDFNHVLSGLMGLNEPFTVDISKLKVGELGDPNNKTFDVVEAFHRMLLGRKVRRVDWEPEEWIELTPKYYVIRNQRDATMNLSILVCLESREAMWEEYEK